ncbi:MAG: HAD hydrolase-like protein [Acidobacteriaceae bacterium]|nr:HAD hydrolase-like protein [Acidobacteriaceae bacterium]MBV9295933.1 HAD hydrolase-like protein [Acidobacteriaceae bacterium]MBV9765187.1 HAD hydrolase-like protein [Acidobacteriaceae bacterium]
MVRAEKAPEVIVFDMDGVLVEVGQSYREAIRETVKHFTGQTVSHDEIQDFKNAGGWNNDWLLSQRLISDRGKKVEYAEVVEYFNQIFLGENRDGLIRRERWMPRKGLLERLGERATLAIFTGRAKYEADATLERYADGIRFHPLITDESVKNPKPAPDGLQLIQQEHPEKEIWYLGDTVDDAQSAQSAAVPFIGVSTPHNPRHMEIAQILREFGAFAVLEDINELEALIQETDRVGS